VSDSLKVVCPCCAAEMVVDPETGAVLSHEVKKGPRRTFEDAFAAEKSRHDKTEEKFGQAFKQHHKREDILTKKFKEAKKKAEESDEEYRNPLDYD
jgi:hypothetical protein